MKQNILNRTACSAGAALLLTLGLTQCGLTKKNCCGYNGPVTSPQAISLYGIDHFIPKDLIDDWTARYEKQTGLSSNSQLKASDLVVSTSCSFNSRCVNLILCNKKCIGLRILHGMDEANKIHIILVGIKPDYSTLYIPKPGQQLIKRRGSRGISGINSADAETELPFDYVVGGLQFSQRP